MIKQNILLLLLLSINILQAQTTNDNNQVNSSSKDGQNRFAVWGNAEMTFFADKNNAQFGEVNFKPIFLWRISDKLFVEADPEFETDRGSLDNGLEYANMCYIVIKYFILHAGRFLPKFGAYRGRMGEGFINRFATNPVGFGDGGIGAQGAFGVGDIKLNYDLYLSNGPILLTDPENAGQFEYEGYIGNNKGIAVGGRIGFLPLSNSSLEVAYSFQNKKKTGDAGFPFENIAVNMQAIFYLANRIGNKPYFP